MDMDPWQLFFYARQRVIQNAYKALACVDISSGLLAASLAKSLSTSGDEVEALVESPYKYRLPPQVGVAVLLLKPDGTVLVQQRQGAHGAGTWSVPGGHVKPGEPLHDAAARETLEEAGIVLDASKLRFRCHTQEFDPDYVTFWFEARVGIDTEAVLVEPDRTVEWRWCIMDAIPKPHFPALRNYLDYIYRTAECRAR